MLPKPRMKITPVVEPTCW